MSGLSPSFAEISLVAPLDEQRTDNPRKTLITQDYTNINKEWKSPDINKLLNHEVTMADSSDVNTNERNDNPSSAIDPHCSIPRLLAPGCGGIPERIDLLAELITIGKDAWISDAYDETAIITAAIERNTRLQEGSDGQRLLVLSAAAVSNRNIDLYHFDLEIEWQFGLHSVEVIGDGACAFRATLISGLAQPDLFHSQVRDCVLDQVLNHLPYYRTVLKPGEKVAGEELNQWIQTMSDLNTYADEMATIAMANAYHLRLVIFRAGDLLHVINPRDGDIRGTAFLVNVGTHYKALVTRPELDEARNNSQRLAKQQ